MGVFQTIKDYFAARKVGRPGFPMVSSRVSIDEERGVASNLNAFLSGLHTITAKFPFEFYSIIDDLTMVNPYIQKYHHTTVALGNQGHDLEIDVGTESQAEKAIKVANDLAARCFPLSGGLDGLINGLLSQVARSGGLCCEWVPDLSLTQVQRAYLIPVKTLRFRYTPRNELELVQLQGGQQKPLNMVQTTFHNAITRDSNPYPIPPAIAAVEMCVLHKNITDKIKVWMDKVSALGVLLASVDPPPREPGEDQATYDQKCQTYLNQIADTVGKNMSNGVGVGYKTIDFQFNSIHAGAQGAKDILQIVLQGLFAGLQRDPVLFGWNFNTTEAFARVVYEEMLQSIKAFRLGIKRTIEHGHRLNYALNGMGDIGVSVHFRDGRSIDAFRDAEAEYMEAQKIIGQIEPGIISIEEARKLLGHEDRQAEAGEFVASFVKSDNRYHLLPRPRSAWAVTTSFDTQASADLLITDYDRRISNEMERGTDEGMKELLTWLLLLPVLPPEDEFVNEGVTRFIEAAERNIDTDHIGEVALRAIDSAWREGKADQRLFSDSSREIGRGGPLTPWELGVIAYLGREVEPHIVGGYLSRSERRQAAVRNWLTETHAYLESGGSRSRLRPQLMSLTARLNREAADVISHAAISRAYTWGNIVTLSEQNVVEFMIDGPRDSRKCEHCWAMMDRRFSVALEMRHIQAIAEAGDPDIVNTARWLKSRYAGDGGLTVLRETSDREVHETGVAAPPYHNRCRDYIVAV